MNHTDLTKGKVYEVVERKGSLFYINDDKGYRINVLTETWGITKHREGWVPVEQPPLLDRTIFRNEWTAMAAIVLVLGLLIWVVSIL